MSNVLSPFFRFTVYITAIRKGARARWPIRYHLINDLPIGQREGLKVLGKNISRLASDWQIISIIIVS